MKGVMKIDNITSTNPVAVGDDVEFEIENENDSTAMIDEIHQRNNYINRQSPRNKYQHHIVAANLDQSMLVATLKEPKTSQGFIDRFSGNTQGIRQRTRCGIKHFGGIFRNLHVFGSGKCGITGQQ